MSLVSGICATMSAVMITSGTPSAGVSQNIMLEMNIEQSGYETQLLEEGETYTWREELRQKVYETEGQIKYTWGMKPTFEGWTQEQGLDCSGYIEYIYNSLDRVDYNGCIESTYTISRETDKIDYTDLCIGDLGMIIDDGSYYTNDIGEMNYTGDFNNDGIIDEDSKLHANHVGIYMGKDEQGNDLWAHCNGKYDTVVINNYDKFKYYYRVRTTREE